MSIEQLYADEVSVVVFPFTRQEGGEETVIGRVETGTFLALPHEAVEVLDDLASGKTIGEVRELYRARHGENPDLADFLDSLAQQGFVRPALAGDGAAGIAEGEANAPQAPAVRYHFESIPRWFARLFFGPPALSLYAVVIAAAACMAVVDPAVVPGRNALLFERHHTAKLLAVIGFSFVTLFVHEMSHLLAARAVGVRSRLGIGHRLWILVAETDMTGLWSVPKRDRFLPLVAGPITDLVSGALLILVLGAHRWGHLELPPLALEMLPAIFFAYVLQFSWQFFFFLRTDFYYVFTTLFDCKNLLGDTEVYLRNVLAARLPAWRFLPRFEPRDQSHIPARERRVIRAYAWFWVLGRVAALALLFAVTLPLTIAYLVKVVAAFRAGYGADPVAFVDAILMTGLSLGLYALGMGLWLRSLRQRWNTSS